MPDTPSLDPRPTGDPAPTVDVSLAIADRAGEARIPAGGSSPAARYVLVEEIARGGMGVVYRACDTVLGRDVAVKVLEKHAPDSAMARRFADEARIMGQLQHPNIPAVHDLGVFPDGRPFLAMKLIKGDTLADLLKSAAPVDRLAVFEAVAQAVGYAHAHGVVHRDLKPANIMVGSFGEVQVMDWGLAKVIRDEGRGMRDEGIQDTTGPFSSLIPLPSSLFETQAGTVLGTPAFMAPEQAAGELDRIDARSDVFGLGAILCVLLTGKPPFDGRDAEAIRSSAVRGRTERAFARLDASGADADVIALCKRCLAFEPADRLADAQAVAAEVAALRRAADDRARQAERDRVAAAMVRFVEDRVFAAARPKGQDGGFGRDVTLRDAIVASLPALATDFADQPLAEARLRVTLGTTFLYLGDAETAAAQFQRAHQLFTDHRGLDHADSLRSVERLAASYAELGRHADALQLRTEVLARRRTVLGHDHADTVAAMSELAKSYHALARHTEALELREPILALRKVRPGPDHPDTLASMKDLAGTYYFLGRHAEALQLREQTLVLRQARLSGNHPDTLQSMFDMAVSYLALGRHAEALGQFEEILRLREAVLGPNHPDSLWARWGLAASYAALGRHAEALREFERTFELRKDKLGPDHPDTLWTVWGLAKSMVALGRGAEAVSLIDECVLRHAVQAAYPRLIPGVLDVRLRYFERLGEAAGCRQTAAMWEAVNRSGAVGLYASVGGHDENRPEGGVSCPGAGPYTAARMRAVAAATFARANQPAEAAVESDRAMAWLRKAVAAGFRDGDHMEKDRDLDALRARRDFQALRAALSDPSHTISSP
jgi:tetratricopeptide (TPR) repeat protein